MTLYRFGLFALACCGSVSALATESGVDFEALLRDAEAGRNWVAPDASHPLVAFLEHATLARDIGKVPFDRLTSFVDRHPEGRLEKSLREKAIEHFAKANVPAKVLQLDAPGLNLASDCRVAAARLSLKQPVERTAMVALYERADRLTPDCAPAFDWLERQGGLSEALLLQRYERALAQRRFDVARTLRSKLARHRGAWVDRSYALHAEPATALPAAAQWPVDPALADAISAAVAQLARRQPSVAETHRQVLSRRYEFSADQQARMQRAIAIYAAADRLPQAGPWFDRMPAEWLDADAWAWRLRAAIGQRLYAPALRTLEGMPAELREDSHFSWLGGRLAEISGQTELARTWFTQAAQEANFHGFLAADRIEAPYALCDATPATPPTGATEEINLQRALAWWSAGQRTRAFREFWYGLQQWSPPLRQHAGLLAAAANWHDAAVWALNGAETRNWYQARFPLAWPEATRQQARANGLHPSWVRGLIRAESTWNPNARSGAGAVGLMQVMPATARGVARRHGIEQPSLTNPDDSIALGSAYLAELTEKFDGQIVLATAAYNAGPGAVERWPRSDDLPIDLWIETISYKETREYVPRVLAFKVIYDWRADGIITRLSDRIPGLGQTPRRRVQASCSAPETLAQVPAH
ncbi:MAG: transglycosylase SLT domain-containing protein [Lysobacterales bacterium]